MAGKRTIEGQMCQIYFELRKLQLTMLVYGEIMQHLFISFPCFSRGYQTSWKWEDRCSNHFIWMEFRVFLGGGFKYVLFSSRKLGKLSNLTNVFADGLKPPTSFGCWHDMIFQVCGRRGPWRWRRGVAVDVGQQRHEEWKRIYLPWN